MVADATRGVKFVIKTELDGNASKPLTQLEQWVSALEKRMAGLKVPVPPAQQGAANYAAQQRVATARARGPVGFAGGVGYGDEIDQAQVDKARQFIEKLDRQRQAAQDKEDARQRAAAERAQQRKQRELAGLLKQEEAYHEKLRQERERDEQQRFRAGNRELASLVHSGPQAVRQDQRRAEHERAMAEARQAEAERRAEAASLRMAYAQQHLRQGFMQVTTAVTGMTRGFVELGLVGERDLAKVQDGLLKVFAATDLIRGGVELWDIAARGARVYSEALYAAAAAEEAVAAASAGRAIVQGHAGLGGVAAGVGAGAVGRGLRGHAAGVGTAYMLGHGARQLGGAIATRIAPGVGVAGVGALVLGAYQGVRQSIHYGNVREGFMRSGEGNTSEDFGASAHYAVHGGIGPVSHYLRFLSRFDIPGLNRAERHFGGAKVKDNFKYKTDEELAEIHKARQEKFAAEQERRARLNEERSAIFAQENAQHDQGLSARMGANAMRFAGGRFTTDKQRVGLERQRFNADRLALEERRRQVTSQVAATIGPNGEVGAGQAEALRAALEVEKQIAELKGRELQLTREEREVAIEGARKKLELIQQQLAAGRQGARGAKENADEYAIRFGRLLPQQQHSLSNIKKELMGGGQLNRVQEEFALQHGDAEMQEMIRKAALERGRKAEEQFGLGGRENREVGYAREKVEALKGMASDTQDKIERDLNVKLKNELNVGKVSVETVLSASGENKLLEALDESAIKFETKLPEIVEAILGRARQQTDQQIDEAIRRQNQQGRGMSGG